MNRKRSDKIRALLCKRIVRQKKMWYNLRGKTDEFYFVENLSMGHFEKGVSTALCVLCLAAGVLLAVLGFGGSYGGGSAGLIFGALIFITVPAVMLFGLYGGSAAKKTSTDPVGIVVGASLVLVSVGAAACMKMLGVLKDAGAWLLVPAAMLIAGIYTILAAAGVIKKKK